MVLFLKKDIINYRPISLLSNIIYKLFTQIITTRLEKKLDENQPKDQATFGSNYSTTDHIHSINQLKSAANTTYHPVDLKPNNVDIIARTINKIWVHRN